MRQINVFTDKAVSDIDYSLIKNNQWVFPTVNIRVYNRDGQGFVASVLESTEQAFLLSPNFTVVGACEYNGIAYIASYNDLTGAGELGCYPSPVSWVDNNTAFERTYKPFHHYIVSTAVVPFRTTLFNWDLSHVVDIIPKLSYDNTINLYFCDGNNPNRVINTGMKITGEFTPTRVRESQFSGALNQLPISTKELVISEGSVYIDTGGSLKPGSYYIYVRYLTDNYARTTFRGGLGPLMITSGNTVRTLRGKQELGWTTNHQEYTDKKIEFALSGIDINYSYIEVAVVRKSAFIENGLATSDTYLINKYYGISGATLDITLYGTESTSVLTLEEVITSQNEYNICKSQIERDSRWIGANWSKVPLTYDRDDLRYLAALITVGEFQDATQFAANLPTLDEYLGNAADLQQYQDSDVSLRFVGYFKDNIYPFGIVFQFTDDSESEVFPLCGTGDTSGSETCKGLYKFSHYSSVSPTSQKSITGVEFDITSAKAYLAGLGNNYSTKFGDVKGFYFVRGERIDNFICQGVVFRGYHGVHTGNWDQIPPSWQYKDYTFHTLIDGESTDSKETAAIIPLFRGNFPYIGWDNGTNKYKYYGWSSEFLMAASEPLYYVTIPSCGHGRLASWGTSYTPWGGLAGKDNLFSIPRRHDYFKQIYDAPYYHKHGVFSHDLLFEQDYNLPDKIYVNPVFRFEYPDSSKRTLDDLIKYHSFYLPNEYVVDFNEDIIDGMLAIHLNNDEYYEVNAAYVDSFQIKGKLNFSSYLPGGSSNIALNLDDGHLKGRNIGVSKYIGIEDLTSEKSLRRLHGDWTAPDAYTTERYSIVNLYKEPNNADFFTDTRSGFNISTTLYYKISSIFEVGRISDYDNIISIYKGDCFLQKSWFRQSRWYGMEYACDNDACTFTGFGSNKLDNTGNASDTCHWYQHGLLVGLMTESKYNIAARNEVVGRDDNENYVTYTFFPKVLSEVSDINKWIVLEPSNYFYEALQINDGYNRVLPPKSYVGYEETEPEHEEIKPNRIYVSDKQIPGAFIDGYRRIPLLAFKDYGIENGSITKIMTHYDKILLVHQYGLNQIFLNQRALQSDDEGDIVLGTSVDYLVDQVLNLATYGSQHFLGCINGELGIYGWDFFRRVIWRTGMQRSSTGGTYLEAKDIGVESFIKKEIDDISNAYSAKTDIISLLPDTPLLGYGIVCGRSLAYKEIMFTILGRVVKDTMGDAIPIGTLSSEVSRIDNTIVFSELLNGFTGTYDLQVSPYYFNIGDNLFSVKPQINTSLNMTGTWRIYIHETDTDYNKFYDEVGTAKLSIIINGLNERENASKLVKNLQGLKIECNKENLYRIIYETLYQTGTYTFSDDSSSFWENAEYLENKWEVPVIVQTSTVENDFEEDSQITGYWVKVTIEYKGTNSLVIRSIESSFTITNI